MANDTPFSTLSDDVVLNIFSKLEDDPRNWARLACVSTKFSSLIRYTCCKSKCSLTIPSVVSDLLSPSSSAPPGGWSSLHKLAVCCPGLLHAGILLENSDFGLERELGPNENYQFTQATPSTSQIDANSETDALYAYLFLAIVIWKAIKESYTKGVRDISLDWLECARVFPMIAFHMDHCFLHLQNQL